MYNRGSTIFILISCFSHVTCIQSWFVQHETNLFWRSLNTFSLWLFSGSSHFHIVLIHCHIIILIIACILYITSTWHCYHMQIKSWQLLSYRLLQNCFGIKNLSYDITAYSNTFDLDRHNLKSWFTKTDKHKFLKWINKHQFDWCPCIKKTWFTLGK